MIAARIARGRRRNPNDGGTVAVEFAYLLPWLALLLVGSFDYGSMANQQAVLEGATRAGAEYARVKPTDAAGIKSQVTGYASFSPAPTAAVATFCTCSDNATVTCPAQGVADPCPASKGQTDPRVFVFVAVQATQTFSAILSWTWTFPSSLSAGTVVRIQ